MKKYVYFLSLAVVCLGCAKIEEPEINGQNENEVQASSIELLVHAPSMSKTTTVVEGGTSKTTWDAGDEIIITYGTGTYTYITEESGASVKFKAKTEADGLPAAASYTFSAAYGSTDDITANQTITDGKNTTKQPISASCTDARPENGELELTFQQLGSLLQLDFAQEDLTINTLKIVSLDETPLIGASTEINLTITGGLSLNSGNASAQIVLNNRESQEFSKGLLLVANEGDAETAVARLIWMGKTINFGGTSKHLVQPLSEWVIGGIKTASDLVCYSYCSNNDLPTRRFTSTPEDPEMEASVTNQVKLLENIDMTGVAWTPVNVFHGIFDGNGKTIDNLVYSYSGEGVTGSDSSSEVGGLFNEFGGNGTSGGRSSILKDLTLGSGCDLRLSCTKTSGTCVVGGIAARVGYGSVIKNVTNNAYVLMSSDEGKNKYSYNGGVVGMFNGSKIANVTVGGQSQFRIDGSSGNNWMSAVAASPLCGCADGQTSVTITDCAVASGAEFIAHVRTYVNYAVETGYWVAGNFGYSGFGGIVGMIGRQKHTAATAKISNCSNAAKLSAGYWQEKAGSITTTRTTGIEISYDRNIVSNLGGIVGMIGHKSNQTGVTVQNCSNTGNILLSGYAQQGNTTHSTAGGIIGLSLSSGSVFSHLSSNAEIILHGQQVGYVGGVIGAIVPNGNGSTYFTGNTATAEYLENHGEVYISSKKTYFKHGDTEQICLGGLVGFAIGQVMASGDPQYQNFSHCYNEGLISNCCSGGDTATYYAFDLGGCFGRVGTCTFDDVINFANVEETKGHGGEVGGFIGCLNTDIKNIKDGSKIDYVNKIKFTNCGQYGNVLAKDVSKNDMGAWIGWTSKAGTHFDTSCSGNKIGMTFGVYGNTSNQTTVTSSNFTTVMKQTNVSHDKKTTLRLFDGSNGPVDTNVFNSFSYGAAPGTPSYETANLSYLSFNIRLNSGSDSGVRAWDYRKSGVAAMLNSIKPDIFGLQEVNENQYSYIAGQLGSAYSVVKGSKDVDDSWLAQLQGEADVEYKPIFYKNSKYSVVSSGTFWLSRTPDTSYSDSWYWASSDTDTAADPYASSGSSLQNDKPRIAVWAIFQEKSSGKKLFVLNTHYPKKAHSASDDNNNHCWTKCSSLLKAKVTDLSQGLPVIIGGDFNIEDNNKRLTPIKEICIDVRKSAAESDNVKSYHNWLRTTEWQGNLDHIYSRGLDARKFETVVASYNGIECLSDHYPVLTEYFL